MSAICLFANSAPCSASLDQRSRLIGTLPCPAFTVVAADQNSRPSEGALHHGHATVAAGAITSAGARVDFGHWSVIRDVAVQTGFAILQFTSDKADRCSLALEREGQHRALRSGRAVGFCCGSERMPA